jgi:HEAT repeat protein
VIRKPGDEFGTAAAQALGELRAKEAVAVLNDALEDAAGDFAEAIIRALGRIGAPESVPRLASIARDAGKPAELRRCAVLALGRFEEDQTAASLCRAFLKDSSISAEAALALHLLGDDSGVAALNELLDKDKPDSCLRAVHALAGIQTPEATSLLFSAAKMENPGVALAAALELVARSEFEGLAVLQMLLAREEVRKSLRDVLDEFEMAQVLYPVMGWLGETKNPELKMALLEVLGHLGIADFEVPADASLADYEKLANRWKRWWEATVAKLPSGPGRLRGEEGETEEGREGVLRGLEWLKKGK